MEKRGGRRSSSRLAALLAREHAGENRRVRLIGRNEMIAASMYSSKFVNEAVESTREAADRRRAVGQRQSVFSWTNSRLS